MAMEQVARKHNVPVEEVRSEINKALRAADGKGLGTEDLDADDVTTYLALVLDLTLSEDN